MPMSSTRRLFLGGLALRPPPSLPCPAAAELVEYYHEGLDHYFVTHYAVEIQALDSQRRAQGLGADRPDDPDYDSTTGAGAGSISVCRFYGNPARGLDSHLYSASKAECDVVRQKWPDEWLIETEEAFRAHTLEATGQCPAGTKAVFRLFNKGADINHRYTTDPGSSKRWSPRATRPKAGASETGRVLRANRPC